MPRIPPSQLTHGMSKTRIYRIWTNMNYRCRNERSSAFPNYGGRGITVCERWRDSFEAFLADMGEPPPGTTLDRIDNDSGYSPDNCRWTSVEVQSQNRRSNRLNPDLVAEIRRRVASGTRARVVSREMGISEAAISMVVNGHCWKNVA